MKKTSFAIIGTGIIGERIINQLLANNNCIITSIFDENQERLTEISNKYNLDAAKTVEELFESKPDWVYIGTPPKSHAQLAKLAASRGCHVLSEKPLAHDVKDGQDMVSHAKDAGIMTAMHFPLMYSPAIQALMREVESNALGQILRVELHTYFPHWPRKWQQNPWIGSRSQGGFIREVFPHYFQIMYRLFGNFSISAHRTDFPEDPELCETGTSALAETESGIPIIINGLSGMGQQEALYFKVFGTEKVITIKNWSEFWISETDQPAKQIPLNQSPSTLWDACCDAINGKNATLVPFEEGLIVQKWIDELLK